jgi:DNA-binding transcriptional ArsR family regulator
MHHVSMSHDASTPETRPQPIAVLGDPHAATLLADPERRRLIDALRDAPDSASGLARQLGDTRQRLNYHLRTLEQAGIVELHEERPRGNMLERVLRVSAERFLVDPAGAEGPPELSDAEAADRFSAVRLLTLAAAALRDTGAALRRARIEHKRLATLSLDVRVELESPAALQSFANDLGEAIAAVVQRHHVPSASSRPFRLVGLAYPAAHDRADA